MPKCCVRIVGWVTLLVLAACGGERPKEAPPGETPATRPPPCHLGADEAPAAGAFAAHREQTLFIAFTPDGAHVLTAGLDGDVRLWSRQGAAVARMRGHRASVHGAVFSPDGRRVATASVDGTARIWDLERGRAGEDALVAVLEGDTREMVEVVANQGGTRLLTLSLGGRAKVWTWDGRAVASLREREADVERAYLSPTQTRILTLAPDAESRLWDADGHRVATLDDHAREGEGAAFAPTGTHFVVWGPRSSVAVYGEDGRRVALLEGHAAQVLDAAFLPDGRRLVTASLDGTARLWSLDGKELAVLRGHEGGVFQVAVSPSGTRLATLASDGSARLWTVEGTPIGGALRAPGTAFGDGAFAPDGERLLLRHRRKGGAEIVDAKGHRIVALPDASGRTSRVTWSPDARHVATIDRAGTPHVYRVAGGGRVKAKPSALAPNEGASKGPPARGDYAGTVVCAGCHREAYEGWRQSSHALTSTFADELALPSEVQLGERVDHAPGWTTFGKDEAGWFGETLGEDGTLQRYPLTHVAGNFRIRFFVTTLDDGRMQVMPAMYEVPTGTWFDYTHLMYGADTTDYLTPPEVKPGDGSFWTGPVRSWDSNCAHCHMSGREPKSPGPDGTGPRSVWRAYAVDCEACHGPGRLHAEAWLRMEMDEALPVLENLDLETRTAVCTACHQEGEVLDPPYEIGKPLYDYIDPTLVVDPERADPSGRALELIYDGLPFATSTCARAGGLTCSTCHAPHGSEERSLLRQAPAGGAFCTPCHQDYVDDPASHSHHEADSVGSGCVACHLPFLTIERGHGAVADHTIGIPRIGLESDRVQPDACTWCHQGGLGAPLDMPEIGTDELRAAYEGWWPGRGWPQPWMEALARARAGDADAGPLLVAVLEDESNAREVRASAAWLLARYLPAHADDLLAATRDPDDLVRRNAVKSLADLEGEAADRRLLECLADPSYAVRVAAARAALLGWKRVQANRQLLEAHRPGPEVRRRARSGRRPALVPPGSDLRPAGRCTERALEAYEHVLPLDPFAHAIRRHVEGLRARSRTQAGN